MGLYKTYDIKIRNIDRAKADAILRKHFADGDIYDIKTDEHGKRNCDGTREITFWIQPYIYEDLEEIKSKFKEAGIQII